MKLQDDYPLVWGAGILPAYPTEMRLEALGFSWKVLLVPSDDPRLESHNGLTVFSTQTIYINRDQTPQALRETLVHEINHIRAEAVAVSLSESTIARLARAEYAFLKQNAELVSWLLEDEHAN